MMRAPWASFFKRWSGPALAALALAAPCAAARAAPADPPAAPDILKVRFGGDDNRARMVIEADGALATRPMAGENGPRRIVLTLPAIGAADRREGAGQGLIRAWRLEDGAAGDRLVLDLAGGGRVLHRFLIPPSAAEAHWRYVIDVQASPPAVETPAVGAPVVDLTTDTAPTPRVKRASRARVVEAAPPVAPRPRPVVVIDPGHGGHDPGAQSADANEKDITLAAARALKARLERDGRYKVVMTRAADVFIPLESRVRIARQAGADLFISLHADSAGGDPATHGASVYTLSDRGEDRVSQVLGAHEWFGRSGRRGPDPAVGQILLDLTQRNTLDRSAAFAGLLVDRIGETVDLLPNTHRDAGYFVLLAPDVPAVLIEMGFISNPLDEARLSDPAQRGRLMDAVAGAIDAYFASRTTLAAR
ncbi:MAG: N-acetylmuramoyl-L-alanine amidase family protein [Caulobacteraceae bacterium]